ncbi:MAG: exosome complex component CSL4 [Bacillariaceae sp.]
MLNNQPIIVSYDLMKSRGWRTYKILFPQSNHILFIFSFTQQSSKEHSTDHENILNTSIQFQYIKTETETETEIEIETTTKKEMESSPPVLRYKEGSTVIPGDRIATIRQVRPGIGTYVKGGHIYACLLGTLRLLVVGQEQENGETKVDNDEEQNDNNFNDNDDNKNNDDDGGNNDPTFICSIDVSSSSSSKHSNLLLLPATSQVLKVGQLIVGRISRITPQNAVVEIRVAEGVGPLRGPPYYEGAIRLDDVRSGKAVVDQNRVVLADCFRPGDLVSCRVISMGDSRRYFLSTAETELGVVRAERKGVIMIPISWKEMECPQTGVRESRKCAKPLMLQQRNSEEEEKE